jgi:hypothetical protein
MWLGLRRPNALARQNAGLQRSREVQRGPENIRSKIRSKNENGDYPFWMIAAKVLILLVRMRGLEPPLSCPN